MRRPAALATLWLTAWSVRDAGAHEYWLAASCPRAAAGDSVSVGAFVGTGFRGETVPYPARRVLRWVAHTSHDLDLAQAGVDGDSRFASVMAADSGGMLFAYESNFAFITLAAEEFDAYLALEGLDGPRANRAAGGTPAAPGRERYARCPKTWVAGSDPNRARHAIGQTLEIVPLSAPGSGKQLAVRVLFQGHPLAGALVRSWHRQTEVGLIASAERDSVGLSSERRTGKDGRVTLDCAAPGFWLVSTVCMTACPDSTQADWQSWWASLTFTRSARARRRAAE